MKFLFLSLVFVVQVHAARDDFSANINSAENEKLGMSSRWSALIKAAKVAKLEQVDHPEKLEQIRKFSESKEWYMRNASLVALNKISPLIAMREAKKLIYDKSLVVRSAAVEIISTNLSEENKTILASEMTKAYNFHKTSSLWIRKQIVEKMSLAASLSDRDFFIKGLFDSDSEIAHMSARILSKITGETIQGTRVVEKWQALVKQNKWL